MTLMERPLKSARQKKTASQKPVLVMVKTPLQDAEALCLEGRRSSVETPTLNRTVWRLAQRLLDAVVTVFLLFLLFPVFLVIALLIKIDSPGPVLFIQNRVGKDGVEFPFYKFRSMVVDAEARRIALETRNERTGPVFKMKDDPRMTRIGRLLRRLSLDELPQFLNILKGEMSLVGPRPALPGEVARYTPRQRERLLVTPGLTGLWQVSGRASLSFDQSIDLDLHYIEHQSLGLYLRILCQTLPAVFSGRGAY